MSVIDEPHLVINRYLNKYIEDGNGGNKEFGQTLLVKVSEYSRILRAVADAEIVVSSAEKALEKARVEQAVISSGLVKVEDEYLERLRAIIYVDDDVLVQSWLDGQKLTVNSDFGLLPEIYQTYRDIWRKRLARTVSDCTNLEIQNAIVQELDGIESKEKFDIRFLNPDVTEELIEKIRALPKKIVLNEAVRVFRRARVLEIYTDTPPELISKSALCPIILPLGVKKKKRR